MLEKRQICFKYLHSEFEFESVTVSSGWTSAGTMTASKIILS